MYTPDRNAFVKDSCDTDPMPENNRKTENERNGRLKLFKEVDSTQFQPLFPTSKMDAIPCLPTIHSIHDVQGLKGMSRPPRLSQFLPGNQKQAAAGLHRRASGLWHGGALQGERSPAPKEKSEVRLKIGCWMDGGVGTTHQHQGGDGLDPQTALRKGERGGTGKRWREGGGGRSSGTLTQVPDAVQSIGQPKAGEMEAYAKEGSPSGRGPQLGTGGGGSRERSVSSPVHGMATHRNYGVPAYKVL